MCPMFLCGNYFNLVWSIDFDAMQRYRRKCHMLFECEPLNNEHVNEFSIKLNFYLINSKLISFIFLSIVSGEYIQLPLQFEDILQDVLQLADLASDNNQVVSGCSFNWIYIRIRTQCEFVFVSGWNSCWRIEKVRIFRLSVNQYILESGTIIIVQGTSTSAPQRFFISSWKEIGQRIDQRFGQFEWRGKWNKCQCYTVTVGSTIDRRGNFGRFECHY